MSNAFTYSPLWSGLFRDDEVAERFTGEVFAAKMIAVELAWTSALAKVGAVSKDSAARCETELSSFSPDLLAFAQASERDGLPVVELVRQMKAEVAAEDAAAIHSGATSQDIVDTAMVLTLLEIFELLGRRLTNLLNQLDNLSAVHGKSSLTARTRMQAALPTTVSTRVSVWKSLVSTQRGSLDALRSKIAFGQFGGAIGLRGEPAGKGEAAAKYASEALGLSHGPVWHADRSRIVDVGNAFATLTGALAKIAQDLCLMSQQGIDEVQFSDQGVSSAMPHKQNPVRAELVIAQARFASGLQGTLSQAMIHEQERSGAAWAIEWLTLPTMAETAGSASLSLSSLLGNVTRLGTEVPK